MVKNSKQSIYTVLLVTAALVLGALLGQHFQWNRGSGLSSRLRLSGSSKVDHVLRMVQNNYVDTLSADSISDLAIVNLLAQLDPHSVYMPPVDYESFNTEMEGEFDGIGVEFNIMRDTVVVAHVLSGGPSSKVDMRDGDRILKVNDEPIANTGIKNSDVIKKLRGKKGTKVDLLLFRPSTQKEVEVTITRGAIPVHSVENALMLDSKTGYVQVNRFIENTHSEFVKAIKGLQAKGMDQLVVDLRGNGGGYLNQAVDMVDEFLKEGLITYTQGAHRKKNEYSAKKKGLFETGKLVILIDESSASASEIVAGAIQDQDRGLIVGRQSFGKGLVQEVMDLPDNSAIRLTIARYYTPSGRCIQKPYDKGLLDYYFSKVDTAKKDTTHSDKVFYTKGGRAVYESGGIHPDIKVELDSSGITDKTYKLWQSGVLYDFAFKYGDEHRGQKGVSPQIDTQIIQGIEKLAGKQNFTPSEKRFVLNQTKRLIAKSLDGESGLMVELLKSDKDIQEALKAFVKYPF